VCAHVINSILLLLLLLLLFLFLLLLLLLLLSLKKIKCIRRRQLEHNSNGFKNQFHYFRIYIK